MHIQHSNCFPTWPIICDCADQGAVFMRHAVHTDGTCRVQTAANQQWCVTTVCVAGPAWLACMACMVPCCSCMARWLCACLLCMLLYLLWVSDQDLHTPSCLSHHPRQLLQQLLQPADCSNQMPLLALAANFCNCSLCCMAEPNRCERGYTGNTIGQVRLMHSVVDLCFCGTAALAQCESNVAVREQRRVPCAACAVVWCVSNN